MVETVIKRIFRNFCLHSRVRKELCATKYFCIHSHSRVECKKSHRLRVETSSRRVELRIDPRVDMRQIMQIRQKLGKLRSPDNIILYAQEES